MESKGKITIDINKARISIYLCVCVCVVCIFTENQDYLLTDLQRLQQRLPTVSSKLMEMFPRCLLTLKLPVQAK